MANTLSATRFSACISCAELALAGIATAWCSSASDRLGWPALCPGALPYPKAFLTALIVAALSAVCLVVYLLGLLALLLLFTGVGCGCCKSPEARPAKSCRRMLRARTADDPQADAARDASAEKSERRVARRGRSRAAAGQEVLPRDAALAPGTDHRRSRRSPAGHRAGRFDHHLAAVRQCRLGRGPIGRGRVPAAGVSAVLRGPQPARVADAQRRGRRAVVVYNYLDKSADGRTWS